VEIVVDLVVVWEAEGAALEVSARVPEGEPEARYRLSIAPVQVELGAPPV